ncbi:MAG TPA: HypC/HybG/HupF family hydrogenase formation chaperone [Acidimicrobiia bacterium]|nr:HypC/HybG/HupF family hydrogenase formation chaperone [Acidimicrobiia bacterium]
MCVAVPARIVSVGEPTAASIPAMAESAGSEKTVDLVMVPEAVVGDYVVVHSGYAIRLLSPAEARATLDLLD